LQHAYHTPCLTRTSSNALTAVITPAALGIWRAVWLNIRRAKARGTRPNASPSDPEQAAYDARRTEFLKAHGYRVIRFWNNEVLNNLDGVLRAIALALG
jgi:hypothetical protein